MGDISLVAQVVVFHNTRAFDQLVKKYQSPVRRFFLHQTCGDSELSDDLAQDTFIKAYTNIASFKNLSSFSTWLYRIAYNVFYDYIRSRKETDDLDTYRVDAQCSTLQQDVGQHMDIYRALATLKEMERTCITLFYTRRVPERPEGHPLPLVGGAHPQPVDAAVPAVAELQRIHAARRLYCAGGRKRELVFYHPETSFFDSADAFPAGALLPSHLPGQKCQAAPGCSYTDVVVQKINLDQEQVVLIANTGA